MRATYPLLAFVLGVLGFTALELTRALSGGFFLDASLLLDMLAYGIAMLVLALTFRPVLARVTAWWLLLLAPLFIVLFPPLAGLVSGVLRLTFFGGWDLPDYVIMTVFYDPVNLLWDHLYEFPLVAVPLTILSIIILWRVARHTPRRIREVPA
jgi:hypothetical protein